MNDKLPSIRFKEFTDDWEQRKVYEIADRFDNLRVPVAANLRVAGETPYYGANGIQDYVDGYTHDGEYVLVAEDGASDLKNYPVNYVNGRIWVNNHAHVLQGKNNIASNRFLSYAISLANIESVLVGGGRAKLNADVMMNLNIDLPTYKEQCRVAEYFSNLDNLITLHQRKYDHLLNIKKSMLEKMFPKNGKKAPEIRFDGFTDDWEQRKLDEILIQRVEHQTISDDAPLLAFSYAEGVINPEDKKTNKRDFIMTDKFSKIFSRTEFNDIIYNPANVIHGAIHRNKLGTGVVSPIYKIFICNGVSPKYMGERLHTDKFIQEITKYIEGTVIKLRTLSPEKFLEMMVEVPNSYEEQEKIGEYFEKLDQLITLHQRKLEKLQNLKISMLKQMFL